MKDIIFKPIGIIHTPFKDQHGTPIQPGRGKGIKGVIEVFSEYAPGLADLDGFSHIILLYLFHKSQGFKLKVTPYLDDTPRGLFATRAPRRPNQIGLSVVRLIRIEKTTLFIEDIDILDGTPLLDIKPYVPPFDEDSECRLGWLENKANRASEAEADDRFTSSE